MIIQKAKQIVDTGQIGNASTGDILYDGGVKLNENFDAVYNTFGDQRKYSDDSGDGTQILHATGYYQKATSPAEYARELPLGSMHDISSVSGPITVRLERGNLGEGYVFINSDGSLSPDNPLIIQPFGTIIGVSGNLVITSPYTKITVWCVFAQSGIIQWNYSIENMFGQKSIPLDQSYVLNNTVREIRISFRDQYDTLKLLLTANSVDGRKTKSSECLVSTDYTNRQAYSTEYAVLRRGHTDEEDELYDISFGYDSAGYLIAKASSTSAGLRLGIKVATTQKIGVAI